MNSVKNYFSIILSLVLGLGLIFSISAYAEEFPDELEKGFSESSGIQIQDHHQMNEDKLKWGGFLRQEYKHFQLNQNDQTQLIQCPSTLGLYFDANFNNGVRGLFRGHMINDAAINENLPSSVMMIGQSQRTSSQLEELKIQFQNDNKVFVTLGVQKVKWGSGKFWNPTDFLNSEKRNLLRTEDQRQGLNLIKLHLPYQRSNFYFIGNFENANDNKSVGGAVRAEFAFATAEMSLTHYSRKDFPSLTGFDASFALGDFDFIFEGAQSSLVHQNAGVAGISWDWQYSDNNFLNFTFEGIWNDAGAVDTTEYTNFILSGQFTPFNVANAYQLFSVFIPKPGTWVNSNLQFMLIRNQMDKSNYHRATYTWTGIRDLSLSAFVSTRKGSLDSEMRLAGLTDESGVEASVKF